MYQHFDEAKFERDLRSSFSQPQADPERHEAGTVILDRNREVSVQIGMMVCREMNRGESLEDIAAAAATAFVEFFANARTYIDQPERQVFDTNILSDIMDSLILVIRDDGSFEQGTGATMEEIAGGHA